MAESLFTTQVPGSGFGNLSDLGADGTGGTTATTMQFAVDGFVTHIRFYATTTVSGTYTAELWQCTGTDDPAGSGTGTLLASTAAVASGSITPGAWNTIAFASPVAVSAANLYRPALHNTNGNYVAVGAGFFNSSALVNGNITGIRSGTNPTPPNLGTIRNGNFRTDTAAGVYPRDSFNQNSYLVDVVFDTNATVSLDGSDAATSSDTAALRVRVRLDGASAASSSDTGAVRARAYLAGSSAAQSDETAVARVRVRLAGSSAAVSDDSASLRGASPAGIPIVTGTRGFPITTQSRG